MNRRGFLKAGFLAGVGALAGDMLAVEPYRLTVKNYDVPSMLWSGDDLNIAVVSDLHTGGRAVQLERVSEVVERTNRLRPDLVLITGDVLLDTAQANQMPGARFVEPEPIAERLAGLRARDGVYFVAGNHDRDWGSRILSRLYNALGREGIASLENKSTVIRAPGGNYCLAGFGDKRTGNPDVPGTLAKIPAKMRTVAMTHNPALFAEMNEAAAVVFAGHTHGGQIRPFGHAVSVPHDVPLAYAYGLIKEGERKVIVSAGIGESLWALRLDCPPEIVMARVRPRNLTSSLTMG